MITRTIPMYIPLKDVQFLIEKLRLLSVVRDVHLKRTPGKPAIIVICLRERPLPHIQDIFDIGHAFGSVIKD